MITSSYLWFYELVQVPIVSVLQGLFQCFDKIFLFLVQHFTPPVSLGLVLGLAQIQTAQGARTLQKV